MHDNVDIHPIIIKAVIGIEESCVGTDFDLVSPEDLREMLEDLSEVFNGSAVAENMIRELKDMLRGGVPFREVIKIAHSIIGAYLEALADQEERNLVRMQLEVVAIKRNAQINISYRFIAAALSIWMMMRFFNDQRFIEQFESLTGRFWRKNFANHKSLTARLAALKNVMAESKLLPQEVSSLKHPQQ